MTKSIACLVLLWISGWLSLSYAQEGVPSSFVPTPETARLVFYTDEWLVWATRSIVAGTEWKRAQTYLVRFFMNRNPGERAHFVYEHRTPGGSGITGLLEDGTLVLEKGGYMGQLILVKPDGTRVETAGPENSPQFGKHSVIVNDVSDDGVLMQLYKLDPAGVGPVYFAPWSTHGLDFGRMILVTDQKGALAGWVVRKKEKIVTIGRTKLQVFNLATRKRVDYPAKPLVDGYAWEPHLQASDAETMIFGTIGIKDGVKEITVTPVFDLSTGKVDYSRHIPERVIAVKDRIFYAVTGRAGDKKEGITPNLLVVAADLDSPNGKRQVLMDLGIVAELVYIVRPDGLSIWTNKEWRRIPWLRR